MSETIATYPTQFTTVTHPLVDFGSNGAAARQATATDFTIWCGVGGIDVAKLAASEITGVFVQLGVGTEISELLDEQIEAVLQANKALAFFHIPNPLNGNGKQNAAFAVNTMRSRGFSSNLIEKDFEQAYENNPATLISAAEAWNYSEEIDFMTGRDHVGYSNPNVLLYKWGVPSWIYWMHWNVARYPQIWYHYSEFFADYPWSIPTGYLSDEFYRLCKGVQFTKKLRAKEYFSVDTLPNGGDGLNSGDGYAFLMTPEELVPWFNGVSTPPIPELEARVATLEANETAILATLTDVMEWIEAHDNAEPPAPTDYIFKTVNDDTPAFAASGTNKVGKPVISINAYQATNDKALKFGVGVRVKVKPEIVDADGTLDYWELVGIPLHNYPALYIRADKVE